MRAIRNNGRSQCKAYLAAAMFCVASGVLFQACSERRESFYYSLADPIKSGELARGWVPDFLPASSRAIHIIYATESPRTWCAFEFSPDDTQHIKEILKSNNSLPPRLMRIGDPGVSWWPNFLTGDLDAARISDRGFVLYVVAEPEVESRMRLLLFVVDWAKGHGFYYRAPGQ